MALLAIKQFVLAFTLLFGCAGGPDEFELTYGHQFAGDSRLGESAGGGWPITNDDSDFIGVGFVWKLRPTRVEVLNPPVRWAMEPDTPQEPTVVPQLSPQDPPQDPPKLPAKAVDPNTPVEPDTSTTADDEHPSALDHVQDDVVEIAEAFNALDWITRILIVVLAGWILFIYRKQIGRLIPGSGKNNTKSNGNGGAGKPTK